jgi:hypothetical protein
MIVTVWFRFLEILSVAAYSKETAHISTPVLRYCPTTATASKLCLHPHNWGKLRLTSLLNHIAQQGQQLPWGVVAATRPA